LVFFQGLKVGKFKNDCWITHWGKYCWWKLSSSFILCNLISWKLGLIQYTWNLSRLNW